MNHLFLNRFSSKKLQVFFLFLLLIIGCSSSFLIPSVYGASFSDGFETGDTTQWTGSENTPTVVSTQAYTGTYSLEINQATEYVYKLVGAQNYYYVRAYVRFTSFPNVNAENLNFIRFCSANTYVCGLSLRYTTAEGLRWRATTKENGADVYTYTTDNLPSLNTWYKIEMISDCPTTDLSGDGAYYFYVNDVELTDLQRTSITSAYTTCSRIYVGSFTENTGADTFHMDEVYVDTSSHVGEGTTPTVCSIELINYSYMTQTEINTIVDIFEEQGLPEITIRFYSMYSYETGYPYSTELANAKKIITACDVYNIDVNVDFHTWQTTVEAMFTNGTKQDLYLVYVENAIHSLDGYNVKSFMAMNEPPYQATTATEAENNFLLEVIATAKLHTDKPVSIRFQGGYSPSWGLTASPAYSTAIYDQVDFICVNVYWDSRYPDIKSNNVDHLTMDKIRADSIAHGKEVWITEVGYPCMDHTAETLEQQRLFTESFVTYAKVYGFDRLFVWVCQPEGGSGEIYNYFNGYTPYPAFYELIQDEVPTTNGFLSVDSTPHGISVYGNNTLLGTTPYAGNLTEGSYILSYSLLSGYQRPMNETVTITAGETTYANVTYWLHPLTWREGMDMLSTAPILSGYLTNAHPSTTTTSAHGSIVYITESYFLSTVTMSLAYYPSLPLCNLQVSVYELTAQSYTGLPTGSAVATSEPLASTELSLTWDLYNFTFSTPYEFTENTYYGISLEAVDKLVLDDTHRVYVQFYNASESSYRVYQYDTSAWKDDTGAHGCHLIIDLYLQVGISITVNNGTYGTASPSGIIPKLYGDNLSILASPVNASYIFSYWDFSSGATPTDNPFTFQCYENVTINPIFVRIYTITVVNGIYGTATPFGNNLVGSGYIITLTATPINSSYFLWYWLFSNGLQVDGNPYNLTATQDLTAMPVFRSISTQTPTSILGSMLPITGFMLVFGFSLAIIKGRRD